MSDIDFASDFPQPTWQQWRALVDGVLKGAPFDRRLVSSTYDGLRIEPLYPKSAGRPLGRAGTGPWHVLARVDDPDPARANAQALEDLGNGATGLSLAFPGAVGACGFGLRDAGRETLDSVLDGVVLDAGIRIEIDLSLASKDAATALADKVAEAGLDPGAVDVAFGYDPLNQFALLGGGPVDWPTLAPLFAGLAKDLADRGFRSPVCAADGRLVHAAGGSEAQELAFALGSALAYLRAMEAGGIPLDLARTLIGFRMAADADQFLTIAKFRALRRLWAAIETACGLDPRPLRLHAETAWRMATRRDPWVNLLRATVAVFAAGVGGADSVVVTPFTQALGLPDAFARRIARNTQLVLLEESNLYRVADPAAGAGGIEALTDALCGKAWDLLQDTERRGGLHAALADGSMQDRIAGVRTERQKAIARRKDALTGTSEFPHLQEAPVAVLAAAPAVASQGFDQFPALAPMRVAEPYEALRDAADAAPARPVLFMAVLGPIADFTARATFARNLFEAGGIAAPVPDGFATAQGTDIEALAAAFRSSGASIACLCSSDSRYGAEAEAAARALKAAGCTRLWLAGRPAEDLEGSLRAAGVDGFVFAGCDVLATLREAHAILGLSS